MVIIEVHIYVDHFKPCLILTWLVQFSTDWGRPSFETAHYLRCIVFSSLVQQRMIIFIIFSDNKNDLDKKPKRRNSGRKTRRKKNKISPGKDMPNSAWISDTDTNERWNNQLAVPKICDENIGKNVNDLKNDFKNKRNDISGIDGFRDRDVYNVIDKLEKVILKDDMYLAGDFDTNDLENDFFYSSDDMEEYIDDS